MSNNVTFLFGAGASAQQLPTIQNLPARLKNFRDSLDSRAQFSIKSSLEPARAALIKDVDWLILHSSNHASIDTYAKKLYIRGDDDALNRLKNVLSLFFTFEQTIKTVDKRYDSFFASIIRDSFKKLPHSIKILTWNYDSQFEIAFREFSGITELKNNNEILNIFTKNTKKREVNAGFSIFKLNGSATFLDKFEKDIFPFRPNEEIHRCEASIKWYENEPKQSNISFAWEREISNSTENELIEIALPIIKPTNVLVIIGYSIPFFNREVDKQLIASMSVLRKVYIQDSQPKKIRDRFLSIRPDIPASDIVEIDDVDQFFLPADLTL